MDKKRAIELKRQFDPNKDSHPNASKEDLINDFIWWLYDHDYYIVNNSDPNELRELKQMWVR